MTSYSGIPAWTSREVNVWRRSWNLRSANPARSRALLKAVFMLFTGLPLKVKTYPLSLGPNAANVASALSQSRMVLSSPFLVSVNRIRLCCISTYCQSRRISSDSRPLVSRADIISGTRCFEAESVSLLSFSSVDQRVLWLSFLNFGNRGGVSINPSRRALFNMAFRMAAFFCIVPRPTPPLPHG